MRGRAVADGTKAYLLFLVRTALFPLVWLWALALARKHQGTDPRAVGKVGAGIAIGLVLAVGVAGLLWTFQDDARTGMYDALEGRLSVAVGEADYQDQVSAIAAADGQLEILNENLAKAEANGENENATVFRGSIDEVQAARADALLRKQELEPNHALFGRLAPVVAAQDDARAKQMIADAPFDYDGMDRRSERAFEIKDSAETDMGNAMAWILYPGVVGVFFAPLFIALGSVLRTAWEPSDTVGYKPYPGASLGLFLLMGAFGVPTLFFAAWGFWDLDVRDVDGQISL